MRTNSLACLCAVAGLGLVGCPGPEVIPDDTNIGFTDTGPRDAGRDARGDSGAGDSGARDTGSMLDTGVAEDAFAEADAGVDAFMMATEDAFGLDAFGLDAFAPDAFVVVPMDAGRDAFVGSDAGRDAFIGPDAGRDAFAADANRDAFIGPDAFHGDAFLPACAPATHLVINEIDYDQTGADTAEFVEIFNPTSAAVPLAGYALVAVNGAATGAPVPLQREYARIALTGSIAPGAYIVVTAMGSTVAGSTFTLPAAIQNGGNADAPAPDGVVLMNGTTVVDAAVYEVTPTVTIASFGPSSGSTPVTVVTENAGIGTDPAGAMQESLSRRPNGCDRDTPMMDWYVTAPTPGAANP